jgi:hypothetical protein
MELNAENQLAPKSMLQLTPAVPSAERVCRSPRKNSMS